MKQEDRKRLDPEVSQVYLLQARRVGPYLPPGNHRHLKGKFGPLGEHQLSAFVYLLVLLDVPDA